MSKHSGTASGVVRLVALVATCAAIAYPLQARAQAAPDTVLVRQLLRDAETEAMRDVQVDYEAGWVVCWIVQLQGELGWFDDARAVVARAPLDGCPHTRLASSLHQAGDPAAALEALSTYPDVEPDYAMQEVVEALPRDSAVAWADAVPAARTRSGVYRAVARRAAFKGDSVAARELLRRAYGALEQERSPVAEELRSGLLLHLAGWGAPLDVRRVAPFASDRAARVMWLTRLLRIREIQRDVTAVAEVRAMKRALTSDAFGPGEPVPPQPTDIVQRTPLGASDTLYTFKEDCLCFRPAPASSAPVPARSRLAPLERMLATLQLDSFLAAASAPAPPLPPDSLRLLVDRALRSPAVQTVWTDGGAPEMPDTASLRALHSWIWDQLHVVYAEPERSGKLGDVIYGWMKFDPVEARERAATIPNPSIRNLSLSNVAGWLARVDLPAAQALARTLTAEYGQGYAFSTIAERQLELGLLDDALQTLHEMEPSDPALLAEVGAAIAAAGDRERAAQVMRSVLDARQHYQDLSGLELGHPAAVSLLLELGQREWVLDWARRQPQGTPRAWSLLIVAHAVAGVRM